MRRQASVSQLCAPALAIAKKNHFCSHHTPQPLFFKHNTMQSFILSLFTTLFAAVLVIGVPVPQLGGLTSALPIGDATGALSDPTAVLGTVTDLPSTVEGLAGGLGGGLLKRADGLAGLDPAAIPGELLSGLGLGDVANVVDQLETTVEGGAGNLPL